MDNQAKINSIKGAATTTMTTTTTTMIYGKSPSLKKDLPKFSRISEKNNGLVPEEIDMEDAIMDKIAFDIINDENVRLEAERAKGLENKNTFRGKKMLSVMNIFQEHGDNRFARRWEEQMKLKSQDEKPNKQVSKAFDSASNLIQELILFHNFL